MKSVLLVALATLVLAWAPRTFASHTLNAEQTRVAAAWLADHPDYRIAEDKDCDCDEEIRGIRTGYDGSETPVPDYHPYAVSGDFNDDHVIDFAVAVVNKRKPHDFILLVFNGPLNPDRPVPAFMDAHVDMVRTGLFYGPPSSSTNRLLMGPFESEGLVLQPRGKTYRWHE
jgi:hypothetical protein